MLFRIHAGRNKVEQWLLRRVSKMKNNTDWHSKANVYYTTSLLIRFSHERETVDIIQFPTSPVRDPLKS
jgi:hypothetical protein